MSEKSINNEVRVEKSNDCILKKSMNLKIIKYMLLATQ